MTEIDSRDVVAAYRGLAATQHGRLADDPGFANFVLWVERDPSAASVVSRALLAGLLGAAMHGWDQNRDGHPIETMVETVHANRGWAQGLDRDTIRTVLTLAPGTHLPEKEQCDVALYTAVTFLRLVDAADSTPEEVIPGLIDAADHADVLQPPPRENSN